MTHEMLVDAVLGAHYSIDLIIGMTKLGFAQYTGNQHNPNWEWNREQLTKLDDERLKQLYARREVR